MSFIHVNSCTCTVHLLLLEIQFAYIASYLIKAGTTKNTCTCT